MRVKVKYHGHLVGLLDDEPDRVIRFEYAPDFIKGGIELSPLNLPLQPGIRKHLNPQFAGLHGLFSDSLPDRYGTRILQKRFMEKGEVSPSALMKLAYVADRGVGALTYEPDLSDDDGVKVLELVEALQAARDVVKDIPINDISRSFAATAGGLGGLNPKAMGGYCIETGHVLFGSLSLMPDGYTPCIIKIDPELAPGMPVLGFEKVYLEMARLSGLPVVDSYLIESEGRVHLALKRFDISDQGDRIHLHSLEGVAHLHHDEPSHTYDELLQVTSEVTQSHAEVKRALHHMVFNLLSNNEDDHTRNFSFLMDVGGEFSLSPAYDLLFTKTDLEGHWMSMGGKRRGFTYEDIMGIAERFLIPRKEVNEILEQVIEGLGAFGKLAKQYAGKATVNAKVIQQQLTQNIKTVKPSTRLSAKTRGFKPTQDGGSGRSL